MNAIIKRKLKRISRRDISPEQAQTGAWSEPNVDSWLEPERKRYNLFKGAMIDYLSGERIVRIEDRYGLRITQIQEQLWRAIQLDDNHQPLGFCALIPGLQVVQNTRHKPLPSGAYPTAQRCKGGFMHILRIEGLYEEFVNKVLKRGKGPHEATVSPLAVQRWIMRILTERGYKKTEYPFNTKRPLYSSIARLIADIKAGNMRESTRANESETAACNVNVQNGRAVRQPRPDPLEEVEADEHKLHSIAGVRITIDGVDKIIPTERPVGIAIVCRGSNAILGGAVCLNPEAKEEALIEAMRSAVVPGYVVKLPSGKPAPPFRPSDFYPELSGGIWTAMHLDNAKIHTGDMYLTNAAKLGAQTCFGPLGSWSGRPNIEGAFGRIVQGYFNQLPSTTGSGSEYTGRRAPAEQAIKWEIEHDDICRLFFQGLGEINQLVSEGVLNQSPVDVLLNYFKGSKRPILRRLPPITAKNPQIGARAVRVKICRRSQDNPNMYINYASAKYTNAALSVRSDLLGEFIIVHVESNLRTLQAFELSGRNIGELIADGHWGVSDHTAEIRRAVNIDKNLRFGQHGQTKTPIGAMLEEKGRQLAEKHRTRKSGGVVKGGLALARQMQATSTERIDIQTHEPERETVLPAVTTTTAAHRARQARQAKERLEGHSDE